jgi:hypothetical protein
VTRTAISNDCIFVPNQRRRRTGSSIKVYFPAAPARPGRRRRQVADADETSEGDDYRPIAGLAFFICFSKSDVGMPYLPTFYLATSVGLRGIVDTMKNVQSTLARCVATPQVQRSGWYDRTGRPGQTAKLGYRVPPLIGFYRYQ